ncbi:MAG: type IV secretion system DNA-binding domain-containing protein [Candidatus Moranbacteria bacterium]|nr:type IV secretion system DNA-binding domain-containing protein [Candidatus Moranbacteria bacterium]
MSDIAFFAKTNFRNQERVFGIKTDDRRRHMYVIGKTGMGKTNLLENLVMQDIRNGHGVAFVDPHGDVAEKIIQLVPKSRINDVIYFNPADQNFPIAFNVMEKVAPEYRPLVASGLVGVFKKLWADSWGPRLEYILRNAILALLEYPGSTLLGVMRILVDKRYRDRVIEKITDPVVKSFWVDEFSKWEARVLQEVVSPIQNKVGQFLSNVLIRNIVGQTQSAFSIREAMDNQKILILNLSKGRIGEDSSALLGAMMITKMQLAAMARVDMPEEERKDFFLYVDEFQNFATESFANILSEARKYRLCLTLANQYITQLEEPVRDAIFGNAGTLITFRVGAADAEFMEKEFEPVFMMNDLVNLPKYHIYLKLMIDGISGDAFSATTLPPADFPLDNDVADKVIANTRERYASVRGDVEDKILRWSGVTQDQEMDDLVSSFAKKSSFSGRESSARNDRRQFSRDSSGQEQQSSGSARYRNDRSVSSGDDQQQAHYSSSGRSERFNVAKKESSSKPLGEKNGSVSMKSVVSVDAKNTSVPDVSKEAFFEDGNQQKKVFQESSLASENVPVGSVAPSSMLEYSQDCRYKEEMERRGVSRSGDGGVSDDCERFVSQCSLCKGKLATPFKSDGSRPVFCREALKEYQKRTANNVPRVSERTYSSAPSAHLTSSGDGEEKRTSWQHGVRRPFERRTSWAGTDNRSDRDDSSSVQRSSSRPRGGVVKDSGTHKPNIDLSQLRALIAKQRGEQSDQK